MAWLAVSLSPISAAVSTAASTAVEVETSSASLLLNERPLQSLRAQDRAFLVRGKSHSLLSAHSSAMAKAFLFSPVETAVVLDDDVESGDESLFEDDVCFLDDDEADLHR